ncbi:hypothetical protein HWV62_8623 [Athelia sp. TMB]|nr:hypothetical protein HWV62_8623 [Athelia sp. TMB]
MPNTPPDSNFTPRREFVKEQPRTANAFSLLAISGSNFIRLYSFPIPVISALRRLLDQRSLVISFREDVEQNLFEFALDGKPWSSPKSVNSERLLLEIIAVIYQHGYSFLSTIDYGREHDDRLAVTFSKPTTSSPSPRPGSLRSGSPMPSSPSVTNSGTNLAQQVGEKTRRRIPFALSFASATLLRVINPPLHSTPAILQAVRGAWPRGVVSEKKIGDASYEFKLKGYKWFQEDTFASDSLRHILTLLSSLDAHAFTLLTSVSLTNRSRVKDLWIFTGSAPSDRDNSFVESVSSPSASNVVTTRPTHDAPGFVGQVPSHRRNPSAPASTSHIQHQQQYAQYPTSPIHARSATERAAVPSPTYSPHTPHTPQLPHSPHSPNSPGGSFLRKPAPRAQVPVSVVLDASLDEPEQFRAQLPSVISSNAENMTGVGAVPRPGGHENHLPHTIYNAMPARDYVGYGPQPPSPGGPMAEAARSRSPTPPNRSEASRTPPQFGNISAPPSPTAVHHSPQMPSSPSTSYGHPPQGASSSVASHRGLAQQTAHPDTNAEAARSGGTPTPPLLGPGVFGGDLMRDSAFSSTSHGTETSQEIPIKWTGGLTQEITNTGSEKSKMARMSTGLNLPGAWADSPDEEKTEADTHVDQEVDIKSAQGERTLQEVAARVDSPDFISTGTDSTRKSEAGLIGVMTSAAPLQPPVPQRPQSPPRANNITGNGGWVLVNVEGKPRPQGEMQPVPRSPEMARPLPPSSYRGPLATTLPPAARALVIEDAKGSKLLTKKNKSGSFTSGHRPTGLKRLLSFSKRDSPPPE